MIARIQQDSDAQLHTTVPQLNRSFFVQVSVPVPLNKGEIFCYILFSIQRRKNYFAVVGKSRYGTYRIVYRELWVSKLSTCTNSSMCGSVSDPYSSDPDPAKNLNPDPDPSYFLPLSEFIFISGTSYL